MLETKLQRVLRNLHPLVCEMGNHEGFEEVGAGYDLRLEGLLRLFIYLWPCWAFTEARGLSLVAGRGCSSRCAWLLTAVASLVVELGLQASVVPAHGLQNEQSSQTRDRTHVPCTGRGILNHCPTSEVPRPLFII